MLEDLTELVAAPPRGSETVVDWRGVEGRLGFELPVDYKELVERYGPGVFDEFIHIFQPECPTESIDLEKQVSDSLWALNYLVQEGEVVPYDLRPPAEIISVGRTDNGDIIYLRRRPVENPDLWPVVVNEARGDDWGQFEGGLTQFLTDVLSGEIRTSIFPASFPSVDPRFSPY
ncbi:SMI1/KNR4 family protein [Kutzneria sp. NPDC052558]|uniref:SMI1/KNR4 family protein n=1 Tax=Kutzneria sp. NPDC052558 TaxID=3364121 RepID=UPI0037CAAFEE